MKIHTNRHTTNNEAKPTGKLFIASSLLILKNADVSNKIPQRIYQYFAFSQFLL